MSPHISSTDFLVWILMQYLSFIDKEIKNDSGLYLDGDLRMEEVRENNLLQNVTYSLIYVNVRNFKEMTFCD